MKDLPLPFARFTTLALCAILAAMSRKILVVEDEPKVVRVVRAYLEQAGFAVVVAYDGQEALAAFRHERPHLVVLDLNLPGMDGLDVCRAMHQTSDVPIIMLTARAEEADRLIGLELGADDYIIKPFSPRELVARVRAVLRRVEGRGQPQEQRLVAGPVELDGSRRQAWLNGQPLDLTATEFDLLAALMQQPGRVFTRAQLLDMVQGEAFEGYERTVDVHIKNLRKKLGDDSRHPRYIITVRGIGYKFAEE